MPRSLLVLFALTPWMLAACDDAQPLPGDGVDIPTADAAFEPDAAVWS